MNAGADSKKCDIVIPVFNRPDLTKSCLDSIYEQTDIRFGLILIDNNSGPETKEYLRSFASTHDNVLLIRNEENLGWVKAVNQGIGASEAPFVCVMNNDTVVRTGGWLSKMTDVAMMEHDIGLVNPHFQAKKGVFSDGPFIEVDFCRGYCMLIKRNVIEKIGLFDESYGLGYYDDDDYSVRAIRAGFGCVRANGVLVEHVGDCTFCDMFREKKRLELHENNKRLFYSRWGRRLKLLFVLTKDHDRKIVSDLFFSLARRQHIIYVWNAGKPLLLRHINIREKRIPAVLHYFIFLALCLNRIKKETKRYGMIFTDKMRLKEMASKMFSGIYYFDLIKGDNRIKDLVESASRV